MDKKNKLNHAAAVIDIGSNELRMEIAQVSSGRIEMLENLRYPVSLGRDTFSAGKISFEKVNKTCEILKGFLFVAEGYGIANVTAVATTAVREAANKDYFIDQINIRTGLSVKILDYSAEKTLIYKEIIRRIKNAKEYRMDFQKAALIVYIGAGNLGVSIFDNGMVPFTQNIKLGSLRLSEMLYSMQDYEEEYSIVIEDYLRGFTNTFYNTLVEGEIKNFIACGREIDTLVRLCEVESNENGFAKIDKKKFLSLYEELKSKPLLQIMEDFELPQENAEMFRSTMSIYNMLLNVTESDKIIAPLVLISDAILFEMLRMKEAAHFNEEFEESTIASARAVAGRYDYNAPHAEFVEKYSLKLFDKTKKIHGLGRRARLYLQVAAILHDVGKYINITSHYIHSYEIVKSAEIVGLDMHETELIAYITKYHSSIVPNSREESFYQLPLEDRLMIAKLTAILRISEALDKGHIKKFDDIDVKIKDNTLIIGISTLSNTKIEEWSFNNKKAYFEEVFGMHAMIKKKKVY